MNAPQPALPVSHAENLVGVQLADGWVITRKLPKPGSEGAEDLTGSFFSIGYIASKDKKEAFLKVIDVETALRMSSTAASLIERLKIVTDSHTFECSILDVCRRASKFTQLCALKDYPGMASAFRNAAYG